VTNKVSAIIGMQFGSEGKGALAGYLAQFQRVDTVACNFTPNAGHTFRQAGHKIVTGILPIGTCGDCIERVLIGPGSVFSVEALIAEIIMMHEFRTSINPLSNVMPQIYIHPAACIVTEEHRRAEQSLVALGSTMKGSMAAVVDRMQRTNGSQNTAHGKMKRLTYVDLGAPTRTKAVICVDEKAYNDAWRLARNVQIEGCQGQSLSIFGPFYPYCTSRDCSIWQLLADLAAPVDLTRNLTVYGAIRTYPIRVANRFNAEGEQIGSSGGAWTGQKETTFAALGVEQEVTTVTKLPRRVFEFSLEQILDSMTRNPVGQMRFYVSFLDYLPPEQRRPFVHRLNNLAPVSFVSDGPDITNLHPTHMYPFQQEDAR